MTTLSEAHRMQITLLAEMDVLWRPIRVWRGGFAAAVLELREEFTSAGIRYSAGSGGDAADRKRLQRRADSLEISGEVTFVRNGPKRTHWKLTDAGDWRWREACNCAGFESMLVAMTLIRAHDDAGHVYGPSNGEGHGVPEVAILNLPSWGEKAQRQALYLEDVLAPALSRRLVASWADGSGRAAYELTPSGRKYLDDPPAPPALPEWSEAASRYHSDQLTLAMRRLTSAKPASRCCVIPLSAGDWPGSPPADMPGMFTTRDTPRPLKSIQRVLRTHRANSKKTARPKRRTKPKPRKKAKR